MNAQTRVNEYSADAMSAEPLSLTNAEKDALGEIGNICMGTSATTLSTLLEKRVTITTPKVSILRGTEYLNEYERPVVMTEVSYTEGIDGNTIFLLKKEDAILITTVLLGGEDQADELYMSAISEVMNQMVGASSTALADILHSPVNIAPPITREIEPDSIEMEEQKLNQSVFIRISFRLEIEDLLTSNIMQLLPYEVGIEMVRSLTAPEPAKVERRPEPPMPSPAPVAAEARSIPRPPPEKKDKVELKAVTYQSFNENTEPDYAMTHSGFGNNNMDLIIDVPLQVTVLLGKSKKSIKEVLEMNRGSVIVLDRLAGEMVDVLVNGKLFARGEVVVIDDNYGVRITELTVPDRSKNS